MVAEGYGTTSTPARLLQVPDFVRALPVLPLEAVQVRGLHGALVHAVEQRRPLPLKIICQHDEKEVRCSQPHARHSSEMQSCRQPQVTAAATGAERHAHVEPRSASAAGAQQQQRQQQHDSTCAAAVSKEPQQRQHVESRSNVSGPSRCIRATARHAAHAELREREALLPWEPREAAIMRCARKLGCT